MVMVVDLPGSVGSVWGAAVGDCTGRQGRRIVVADLGETVVDLVRDMTWVLTSMCARLWGGAGRVTERCGRSPRRSGIRTTGSGWHEYAG